MDFEDMLRYLPLAVMGLAVLGGLVNLGAWFVPVLIALGAIVGFMNIRKEEVVPFLVSTLSIAGAATLIVNLPTVGGLLAVILANVGVAAGSMAIPVALKSIYKLSKD